MSQDLLEKIIISASNIIRKDGRLSEFKFSKIKREIIKNLNIANIPQNTQLIPVYHKLIKSNKISASPILESILRKKKIRTLSGIASVTVITPDFGCPGKCIYCPTEKGMPKSYLSNEPAVMRAIANKFDPYFQVKTRLQSLTAQGHKTDKIEIIIAGGTWSSIPESFQTWFVANCYAAANNSKYIKNVKLKAKNSKLQFKTKNLSKLRERLKKEQTKNEKTKNRIIGLTLETRPDWINESEIKKIREYGCTRVELGVQNINDKILEKSQRGHTIKETIRATKLLKDAGFKINYHIMLGLPGATPKTDAKMIENLFTNQNFQPDMLKIYPCVVIANTPLHKLWKEKKYKPFSDKQIVNILKDAKTKIPEYCRVVRVIRDIPTPSIVDGGKVSNLREVIHQEMAKEGKFCRCIRCREIKDSRLKTKDLRLLRKDYSASDGYEVFLSFEDVKNDKLVALLRLRIPSSICNGRWFPEPAYRSASEQITETNKRETETAGVKRLNFGGLPEVSEDNLSRAQIAGEGNRRTNYHLFSALDNTAIIREVHTYGQVEKINTKGAKTQHLGLGKKLVQKAEKIVKKEFNLKKISVISGIGARNYYRKLGYKLKDTYMIKDLRLKTKNES